MPSEEEEKRIDRAVDFCKQYAEGEISKDVLLAHLKSLGYPPAERQLMWMNAEHAWVDAVVARREHLMRNPPKCPSCDAEQVQLVSPVVPARWKCRMCKYLPWVHEPQSRRS